MDTAVFAAAAVFGALLDPAAMLFSVLAVAATNLWIVYARRASLGKLVVKLRVVRAFGSHQRCAHDYLADTAVVHDR